MRRENGVRGDSIEVGVCTWGRCAVWRLYYKMAGFCAWPDDSTMVGGGGVISLHVFHKELELILSRRVAIDVDFK